MSAFIVSTAHVSAIVNFAAGWGVTFYDFKGKRQESIGRHNAESIGRILMAENAKSVAFRYGKSARAETRRAGDSFALLDTAIPTCADVVKACECLEYQSCEHAGWPRSQAREILNCIIAAAASDMAVASTAWHITA